MRMRVDVTWVVELKVPPLMANLQEIKLFGALAWGAPSIKESLRTAAEAGENPVPRDTLAEPSAVKIFTLMGIASLAVHV